MHFQDLGFPTLTFELSQWFKGLKSLGNVRLGWFEINIPNEN